jgi:RecB family exonuclease
MSIASPSLEEMLAEIAEGRRDDPLAPVTVICPTHLSALQMRRRLAQLTPFAAVRFETLPRLAELLGAGRLAAQGRRPMARPIGDHLAERVAAEARFPLDPIRELPGFARALRRLFARLRGAGLCGGEPLPEGLRDAHLAEVVRLYGLWRAEIAGFYDEDDLLDAAADAVEEDPGSTGELGRVYLVPPSPRSQAGSGLVAALAAARGGVRTVAEPEPPGDARLVMAPDLASEAREAVREVLRALDEGVALHQVAVLHGADDAYAEPLRQAMEAASLPTAAMPGTPLDQSPAGRGVLALLEVALSDLSRTSLIDALGLAPVRRDLPSADGGRATLRLGRWDRLSRAAGITHGARRWQIGIDALCEDRAQRMAGDGRGGGERPWLRDEIDEARELLGVALTLWGRLEGLRPTQPAGAFLARVRAIVADYLDPDAVGTREVLAEVERLGTIDAVGGNFSLTSFHRALRVNLEAASLREGRFGEGVLVADHRRAAGLRFERVVLCGAVEGLLPAGPGVDALVADVAWESLRAELPFVEDAASRVERAAAAAARALGAGRSVVMTCPLYEGAGAREHYPSPLALSIARRHEPAIETATALRARPSAPWLRRTESPLAAQLAGPAIDAWEIALREAVVRVRDDAPDPADDPLGRALRMLRARTGPGLSEWDGNLVALAGDPWMRVPASVSPTRLEQYGACGYRFFLSSLLGLRVPEQPRDAETIDPLVRGNVVHGALEDFFRERALEGRPGEREPWTAADAGRLATLLDARFDDAHRRGLAGLPVFSDQQRRALHADMRTFLDEDSRFRRTTGAVPHDFEMRIDVPGPGGQAFHGYVDRVDRDAGGRVWVVDYKTGRAPDAKRTAELGGGTLLQLPVYLLCAAGASEATALYWYISARGGFAQVPYTATPVSTATFERVVASMAAGVAAGSFPAVPGDFNEHWSEFENCRLCDFTRICSRARGNDFARKRGDAGMAPWAGVAAAAAGAPT